MKFRKYPGRYVPHIVLITLINDFEISLYVQVFGLKVLVYDFSGTDHGLIKRHWLWND